MDEPMKIVGANLYHDGSIAAVEDGELVIHVDAQKDNHPRYCELKALTLERLWNASISRFGQPDIVGVGGWFHNGPGYFGIERPERGQSFLPFDSTIKQFATTHERAHIFCSYALSPFPQGEPCYMLVYEGSIGSFYRIDSACSITKLSTPLREPGHRYAALFELADERYPAEAQGLSSGAAGKLMALAGTPERYELDGPEAELLQSLLKGESKTGHSHSVVPQKHQLRHTPYWNSGHLGARFRSFASKLTDALFDQFYAVAKETMKEGLPLLISGGCGLNCSWNSRWLDSGLFRDVFIPPCTDDSGISIGVAADAQFQHSGNAKLRWNVYSGEDFVYDMSVPSEFENRPLDFKSVADLLVRGAVIAWVQGKYEIGPRALGNRSLLAAPFDREMTDRLNWIKHREKYRPVAPVCLENEVHRWFEWNRSSPFMLHFQRVLDTRLRAITHDDGSARVQTVNKEQNPQLHELLQAFSNQTGVGVLCNTSLNFPGFGFINRTSDLVKFVVDRNVDAMVISDQMYVRRPNS
jgi:predicted NodU family carbamoyl transferase